MNQNILLATDLGDGSLSALRYGMLLAKPLGAKLHLLYVYQVPTLLTHATLVTEQALHSEMNQQTAMLLRLRDEVEEAGVSCTAHAHAGPVAETLLRFTDELKPIMVIMGVNNHGALKRMIRGSLPAHLSNEREVPVLIVKAPRPDESAA